MKHPSFANICSEPGFIEMKIDYHQTFIFTYWDGLSPMTMVMLKYAELHPTGNIK
jgi:hypothetical protein